MNKRQRKKKRTQQRHWEEHQLALTIRAMPYDERASRIRRFLLPHKRRHWLSTSAYQYRRQQVLRDLQKEEDVVRQYLIEQIHNQRIVGVTLAHP